MRIVGLSLGQLEQIAGSLDLCFDNFRSEGQGYAFRLTPKSSRGIYARRSPRGRHLKATCYHGYRDFIIACFATGAESVRTVGPRRITDASGRETLPSVTYHDVGLFLADLSDFGKRQLGSIARPVEYLELCDCETCDGCSKVLSAHDLSNGCGGNVTQFCVACHESANCRPLIHDPVREATRL